MPRVPLDHRAQQVLQADPLVPLVRQEPLDHKDPLAPQAQEQQEPLAHKVPQDLRVFQAHRVLLEPPVPLDLMEPLA